MTAITRFASRPTSAFGVALTTGIVALALTTGWIHLGLGGLLFTLNGLGYAGLAGLYVVAAIAPHPLIAMFGWAARVALASYTGVTILAWAIQGPYFPLAYIAKAVEAALIALIVIDVYRVHGGPVAMVRTAWATLFGRGTSATAA